MIGRKYCQKRRLRLLAQMKNNSIAIFATAPHHVRSLDQMHRFYPDHDFYYLTGFSEPHAIAVLLKLADGQSRYILFNQPHDPEEEQWVGPRVGQVNAIQRYGADEAYAIQMFSEKLMGYLLEKENIYNAWGRYSNIDQQIQTALQTLKNKKKKIILPETSVNIENLVHEMRLIKDEHEIALMRKAAQISIAAHQRAMQQCRAEMTEAELHAEIVYELRRLGCEEEAYDSIVAGGESACILHYFPQQKKLAAGSLVLIDAAGQYQGYDADITRTFPVSGQFNPAQKALYEIVLAAQKAAINVIKPGVPVSKMHEVSLPILVEGLVDLGILQGKVSDLIEQKAYRPYYMHGINHWLGLDVHDVGHYQLNESSRHLEAGMVTTVEPGLYIRSDAPVDQKWRGIGVRIEDDVLVTASGNEVLSAGLVKEVKDIEALMKHE